MDSDKRNIIFFTVAYLTIFIFSFAAANLYGLGQAESLHHTGSPLLYIRRLLMAGCALMIPLCCRQSCFEKRSWHITPKWLLLAIVIGIIIGYGNRGGFDPRSAVALLLAAFHTFATELFFRAYCIRTLSKKLNGFWLPIFISALLYGLFYLSVWTIWQQPGFMKVPFVMLFTGLGIVFGFCYRKSGSFLVPWIMHFFGVLQYKLLF